MANGEPLDNIDKLWSSYDSHGDKDRVIAWERQAATNMILASVLKDLPKRIHALEKASFRIKGGITVIIVLWVIATTLLMIFLK